MNPIFKAARRTMKPALMIGLPFMVAITILVVVVIGGSSALALGDKLAQITGISKQDLKFLKDVNPKLIKQIKKQHGDEIYAAFDCSNYAPSKRKPGVNCIQGLIASMEAKNQGPVPERAEYLVPIWQAAANRYNLPWQLIAAVNATRTDFGWIDCNTKQGDGFYRIEDNAWENYATNAGGTPLQGDGPGCYQVPDTVVNKGAGAVQTVDKVANADSTGTQTGNGKGHKGSKGGKGNGGKDNGGKGKGSKGNGGNGSGGAGGSGGADQRGSDTPVHVLQMDPLKKLQNDHRPTPKSADTYDPVDATFTTARMLASNGAFNAKDWNYTGSASSECTTDPGDGRVWYLPKTGLAGYGSGGKMGYNSKLQIPQWALQLAAKWRSNKGPLTPRQADSALDQKLPNPVMPEADVKKLLTVAWEAFGVRGQELKSNVERNAQQTMLEVHDEPYLMQSIYLIDGNQNDPARGMFGFIPETFDFWHVDGFNDIYNPLDNILAAVNAQVNGPHTILDGSSGWSVPLSHNPYTTGGKTEVIGSSSGGKDSKPATLHPYRGKPQTDRVSKAVAYQEPHGVNSECYVAVVHEWYEAIKKHPPPGAVGVDGDIRNRIVQIAQQELAKNVSETGGDNHPLYHYPGHEGETAPYNIDTQWCAAFASWVWYQAGIKKQMTDLGGMTDSGGLTLPAAVSALYNDYGKAQNMIDPKPQPGDFIIFGPKDCTGMACSHVEIVEKVDSNGNLLSAIGGNTSDAVERVTGEQAGIAAFVKPPNATPTEGGSSAGDGKLQASFTDMENGLSGKIGLSVARLHGGSPTDFGHLTNGHAWSSFKVPLLATVMSEHPLSSDEKSWATSALEASDNTGAANLFSELEKSHRGLVGASKAIEGTLKDAGDTDTTVATAPPPTGAVSTWGQTEWSADDATTFYRALANGKVLNQGDTNYVLGLMHHVISSQQWGLGSVDWGSDDVAFKAGWGPDTDQNGAYLVRQSGIIHTGKGGLVVTMLATNGAFDGGVTDLNQIAQWVHDNADALISGDSGGALGSATTSSEVTASGPFLQDLAYVEAACKKYKVPVWIEWGIAGAESTWGQGGDNLFGLLAAAGGVNVSDWQAASMQSAKTMAGLKDQYGSWEQAMEHYSGGDYGLDHPRQLSAQGPS